MRSLSSLLFFILLTGISACKKKDVNECPFCPSVQSISPSTGPAYTTLTITGKNFSSVPKENIIKINGITINPDSILLGNQTQLVVKVPKGCGTGPVTVDLDDELTNYGEPPVFTYQYRNVSEDLVPLINQAHPVACSGGSTTGLNKFELPAGIIMDTKGDIFFADYKASCLLKLSLNDNYKTPCLFAGTCYKTGNTDGVGTAATFTTPRFICIDNSNNLFIAENTLSIRNVTNNGNVITLFKDSSLVSLSGVALLKSNNAIIYAASLTNQVIYKIVRNGTNYMLSLFAGTKGVKGYVDGPGSVAKFNLPQDMVTDKEGNLFVADATNNVIRKITPTGIVSTFAGNGSPVFSDGQGINASFHTPLGLFIDEEENIFVADNGNNAIRKISKTGLVSTIYTFTEKTDNPKPNDVVRDIHGNFYVTYMFDNNGNTGIKKISTQ